jgi:cytochrome oxidase assembly protein ShyY1
VGLALVIGVTVLFARLGAWQLSRLEQRRALEARVAGALAADPVPVGEVGALGADDRFRRVTATGTYDAGREVLLYGRPLDGEPGHHLLTPLLLDDGRAVIVDRGWVPFELDAAPVAQAAPPPGEVRVIGVALPPETDGAARPGAAELRRIDLDLLADRLPYELLPFAVLLQEQVPPQPGLPRIRPFALSPAPPHLSYAIQWFAFAAIALVGYAALLRRESRARYDGGSGR